MKKIKWVLITGVVSCIFIGAYFAGKMFSTSPVQSTQNRRNNTVQSSPQTNSSSESSRSSDSLDYNTITPMQTAASIAYYGDHDVQKGFGKASSLLIAIWRSTKKTMPTI